MRLATDRAATLRRFKNENGAVEPCFVKQPQRHDGRLASAGFGSEHRHTRRSQRRTNIIDHIFNRQTRIAHNSVWAAYAFLRGPPPV